MRLLALETSADACSVALLDDGQIYQQIEHCPQQQSQRALPMLQELLLEHDYRLRDIDGMVYAKGPGSFTGVRIGISMVQGVVYGADLPVYGVSTLAAMCHQANSETQTGVAPAMVTATLASMDARMGELYYRLQAVDGSLLISDSVASPQRVPEQIDQLNNPLCVPATIQVVGNGFAAYPETFDGFYISQPSNYRPTAHNMLAMVRDTGVTLKDFYTVDKMQPSYIRNDVSWKKLPNKE